ncbi:MAG: radical SAM protein [Candidatus Bathyarchaeota archaeon]|nr:MAG: radical SAM protein [Candidatus Bathyarchaeota archaeon]
MIKYYEDRTIKLCKDCLLHAKIFVLLVDSLFSTLGFEKEGANSFFKKTLYRRVATNIVKGIAKFGITKPLIAGAPIAVVWNFTNHCNLRCSHCYTSAPSLPNNPELSTKDCFEVINRLVEANVATLNFSGGEPLVREDFFEVARYAREQELQVSLASNGILLTKNCVSKLNEIGVSSINISLDGALPETHERIRNLEGCFDLAINGITNSVKYGNFSEVIVNTTLTKFTIDEIPKTYELVKRFGVDKYYVSRILPTGRGKAFSRFDVSSEEKIKILTFMYEKFKDSINGTGDIPVLARGMTYFARVCHEESHGSIFLVCEILTGFEKFHQENLGSNLPYAIIQLSKGELFSGCATGLYYCGLSPEGEVLPCAPATNIKMGNLLKNNLEDIWSNHPIFNNLRKRNKIKGQCGHCGSKSFCGGCRLTSFGTTGDWMATDPSCPF